MALDLDNAMETGDPFLLFRNVKQFECSVGGAAFDVYELRADEDLFSSFAATVTLVSRRRLETKELLGKTARVRLRGRKMSERFFHGMVNEYEELPMRRSYKLYRIRVVSELWALTRISNVRIFQDMTVPEIIEEILKDSRIFPGRYKMNMRMSYAPREYCVQYRETNWDFIRRLMAEEGMFFYHAFADDRHVPVFTDTPVFLKPIPGPSPAVLFSKKGQLVNYEDHITSFEAENRLTVETVRLRDYHFTHPSAQPGIEIEAREKTVFYSLYDYPGGLNDERTAYRLADVHLQRETWKKRTFRGEGVCRTLTPGHTFSLTHHIKPEFNTEYTVVSVIHQGRQPQVMRELEGSDEGTTYGNTFTCIPKDVEFRPDAVKKPTVSGIQSAVVVGPENEEIYTDEWGRIKVKFHWDLLGKDERASCWVRVSQIWAGACETIFTPRVGQEVLVDFLDGDPDRPVVIGTVFNGRNLPPYSLPRHKTRSTIKTHTVKGEGFNELRFEDLKGEEEIYIHGQKDWNIEILNDKTQTIGRDERLDVKNDRTKTVGRDQKEDVKNDKTITVGKNHRESVGENMGVTVGKNLEERTGENKTVAVGKNLEETVGDDAKVSIGKNRTLSVGDNSIIDTGKDLTETVGSNHKRDVGDDSSVSVGKNLSVMVGRKTVLTSEDQITLTCGGASIIMKSDGTIQVKGMDISIDAGGNLVTKGRKISGN